MNLFEHAHDKKIRKEAPLADRMRPRTIEEFVGQSHILAPGHDFVRQILQKIRLDS